MRGPKTLDNSQQAPKNGLGSRIVSNSFEYYLNYNTIRIIKLPKYRHERCQDVAAFRQSELLRAPLGADERGLTDQPSAIVAQRQKLALYLRC